MMVADVASNRMVRSLKWLSRDSLRLFAVSVGSVGGAGCVLGDLGFQHFRVRPRRLSSLGELLCRS